MKQKSLFQKELFLRTLISTVLFGLAAHAYSYFNLFYSHDSLLVYQWSDATEMIGVGRFLVPAYMKLRGSFYPPFLVGLLSLLLLAVAAYLILELLELRSRVFTILLPGVLATSTVLTLINATYIKDADTYMLALLLDVAAVYVTCRFRWGLPVGMVCITMASALYQSFLPVAVFLAMIFVLKEALEGKAFKEVLLTGIRLVAMLLLGLILYYVALNIVLRVTGVGLTAGYNSLSDVGKFESLSQILTLLRKTWSYSLTYFRAPEGFRTELVGALNTLVLICTVVLLCLLIWRRHIRGLTLALTVAVFLLMPFGMNVVYFISKGVVHALMMLPLYLIYFLAAMLCEMLWADTREATEGTQKAVGWARGVLAAALAILIFNGVVFSNQAYLKKDMEYQTTLVTLTRIMDRIEQVEGYTLGETPVIFVGTLSGNGISGEREHFKELTGVGLQNHYAVTYSYTYQWFFQEILSYPIRLQMVNTTSELAQREDISAMPVFPALDSCKMIDGTVIVKLG